ncbi:hypothetical protein [Pseudobutyrivibrio xylanivorans]|uniref:hypothetical protein n=1 Tax=Pseudobutyrivibrio xylanivorans TaxID=185007 RepID=UPI000933BAF8|nr:hypothetical protein [Pseudobutyrivibrio xylanivorans]
MLDDVHINITDMTQIRRNLDNDELLRTAGIGCRGVDKYSQPEQLVAGEATATQIEIIMVAENEREW